MNLNSDEQLVWYPLLLVKHRFYYVSVVQQCVVTVEKGGEGKGKVCHTNLNLLPPPPCSRNLWACSRFLNCSLYAVQYTKNDGDILHVILTSIYLRFLWSYSPLHLQAPRAVVFFVRIGPIRFLARYRKHWWIQVKALQAPRPRGWCLGSGAPLPNGGGIYAPSPEFFCILWLGMVHFACILCILCAFFSYTWLGRRFWDQLP